MKDQKETFRLLKDLWTDRWATREDGEAELKRNGYATATDKYELREHDGQWKLSTPLPPDPTSQVETPRRVPPKTRPKPGRETAKTRRDPEDLQMHTNRHIEADARRAKAKVEAEAPPEPPQPKAKAAKEAKGKAKETVPGQIPGGPNPTRLPANFVEWAIEKASGEKGVMRAELATKSGQNCRWLAYMKSIAPKGTKVEMDKVGSANRFKIIKA